MLPVSRPLRVLFLIPGDGQGSSMIFARRQAESLTAEGVKIGTFFLCSRTSLILLWHDYQRFRRTLRADAPDVIHAHYGTVTAMFAALASGRRPLVVTYRGSDLNSSPVRPRAV